MLDNYNKADYHRCASCNRLKKEHCWSYTKTAGRKGKSWTGVKAGMGAVLNIDNTVVCREWGEKKEEEKVCPLIEPTK